MLDTNFYITYYSRPVGAALVILAPKDAMKEAAGGAEEAAPNGRSFLLSYMCNSIQILTIEIRGT